MKIALAAILGLLGGVGGCAQPAGEIFAPGNRRVVWPAAPNPARIRYVGSIGGGADLKPGKSAGQAFMEVLRGAEPAFKLGSPHSVAVNGQRVLVTSPANSCVHLLDLDQRWHRPIRTFGNTAFRSPVGVTTASQSWFVTDSALGTVVVLDSEGQLVRQFGQADLKRPTGIVAVPEQDRLYVLDTEADACVIFSTSGQMLSRFGASGVDSGQFNRPTNLAWHKPDRLWIADTLNSRLQQFDLDGKFVSLWGRRGDAAGDLSLPKGIALDRDGHIYVVDAHFENVQIFDESGQLLLSFSGPGKGSANLSVPAGIAIDAQNRIWVADTYHHRLAVFEYLPLSEPPPSGGGTGVQSGTT